jgi:hypothetical protein
MQEWPKIFPISTWRKIAVEALDLAIKGEKHDVDAN